MKLAADDAHDRNVLLAWHVGLFTRLKSLGDPTKWFSSTHRASQEPQSTQQQLTLVKILAEMGGKFTTRAQREAAKAAKAKRKGTTESGHGQ